MKKLLSLFLIVNLFISCIPCKKGKLSSDKPKLDHPVVIIYENDVHCAVEGYAKMVTVREQQKTLTPYVTTVSCGDYIQGDLMGAVSDGDYIIDIMNKVGYDVVTIGNHEFDFEIHQMFKLMKALDASVVNANFYDLQTGKVAFPSYKIMSYGQTKIAFLGLTTTTTLTNGSNKFKNVEGQFIYNFSKINFYEIVQKEINRARKEGADYIVVLSHLGELIIDDHPNSYTLISKTTGIDVVLDAHTHHYLPDTLIYNQAGQPVLMSSTGTKFESVGVLTLSKEGVFQTKLKSLDNVTPNAEVQEFVDKIKIQVNAAGKEVIGYSEITLSTHDKLGKQIVRDQETCLGNFSTDAFRIVLETDIALINGGGFRDSISQGNVTFNDFKRVFPFGNKASIGIMTGQQICDVLECAVKNLPEEFGEFLQVSGLKFELNTSISSPVLIDENGMFIGVGNGPRRVSKIEILNRETGNYEAIDLKKIYSIASLDYLLVEGGGQDILSNAEVIYPDMGQDVEILSIYIKKHLNGVISNQYAFVEDRIRIIQEACLKD